MTDKMSEITRNIMTILIIACSALLTLLGLTIVKRISTEEEMKASYYISSEIEERKNDTDIFHDCRQKYDGFTFIIGTRPEVEKTKSTIKSLKDMKISYRVMYSWQQSVRMSSINTLSNVCSCKNCEQKYMDMTTERLIHYLSAYLNEDSFVIVVGDTNTAYAASLSAFRKRSKLFHIEAGLRTFDLSSPYPEEMNRVAIDNLADYNFAPTLRAKENLHAFKSPMNIMYTGNPVVDVLPEPSNSRDKSKVLVTLHRREIFGERYSVLVNDLLRVANKNKELKFEFILHSNPKARLPAISILGGSVVEVTDFLSKEELLSRVLDSRLLITDSGGLQEEAISLGVPVIVVRNHTERMEGVETGRALLAGSGNGAISTHFDKALEISIEGKSDVFGDGKAGKKIACWLKQSKDCKTNCDGNELEYKVHDSILSESLSDLTQASALEIMKGSLYHPSQFFRDVRKTNTVTYVLCQYRRKNLQRQIDQIRSSDMPGDIVVWNNAGSLPQIAGDDVTIIDSTKNYKYHGRFIIPLLSRSEFCVVLDDDTGTSKDYVSRAVEIVRKSNAIVGSAAHTYNSKSNSYRHSSETYADIVGHAWVYKCAWTSYMWGDYVPTMENGEDINLSTMAWLKGGVKTMFLSGQPGLDSSKASSKNNAHRPFRFRIYQYFMTKGWRSYMDRNRCYKW